MKYTDEVYKLIATRRPSLTIDAIDARSASYIMALTKEIDEEAYTRIFRNK